MSRAYSSFIPADQVQEVRDWQFDPVNQAELSLIAHKQQQAEDSLRAEQEAQREAALQEGYDEGYRQGIETGTAQGYETGYQAGHSEAQQAGQAALDAYISTQGREAAAHLLTVLDAARQQLDDAEQHMAQGSLELACALARQVLRHELRTQPQALQHVVHEALGLLLEEHQAASVRLHPQDLELLHTQAQTALRQDFPRLNITLVPDASLSRGGCVIDAAGTTIDASTENRWQRAIARLGLDTPWQDPGTAAAATSNTAAPTAASHVSQS